MAALEESSGNLFLIDESYEFSAPRFYDFIRGETDEDVRKAELWFENARPHAPSPFMLRIKASRTVQHQISCNFSEDEQKAPTALNSEENSTSKSLNQTIPQEEAISAETTEEIKTFVSSQAELTPAETKENNSEVDKALDAGCSQENVNVAADNAASTTPPGESVQGSDICTPAPQKQTESKNVQTAKKIASKLRNTSAMSSKNQLPKSQVKSSKPTSVRSNTNGKKTMGTPNTAHENHAIKRQKLEGGKSRQILTVNKLPNLPHKTRCGTIRNSSKFCSLPAKSCKEDRTIYVREPATPFVSMAEMMRKFQSSTREMFLSSRNSSLSQAQLLFIFPFS